MTKHDLSIRDQLCDAWARPSMRALAFVQSVGLNWNAPYRSRAFSKYQGAYFQDHYRISNMTQADIDLTDDERNLLGQITFDLNLESHDPEDFTRNSEGVAQLITMLLKRRAIPEHRLKYFTDPDYQKSRIKGAHRDLFRRNGNNDEQILRHPHFLKYARYFVCGPDLPGALMQEFRDAARRCGHVSPGGAVDLANLARRQVRAFDLAPHDAAEEYFKLALDSGIWMSHAFHIADRVRTLR